jgi:hypothetical protein
MDKILGWNEVGKNGNNIQHMGYAAPALGVFNAWNSWNQGNKMYDLQKDAFDFSQEKFWLNYMNKLQDKNRYTNRVNSQNAWRAAIAADPSKATSLQAQVDTTAPFQTDEYIVPYGNTSGTPIARPDAGSEYINPAYTNRAPTVANNGSINQTAPNVAPTAVTPVAPAVSPTAPAANAKNKYANSMFNRNRIIG